MASVAQARQIACIGTGIVGRSWALTFVRAGCQVRLWDPQPGNVRRAVSLIEEELEASASRNRNDGKAANDGRVAGCSTIEEAISGADYIQESAPESLPVKRALFQRLDALAPHNATLASSTSALRGSQFAGDLARRRRVLVVHPVNPPHLIPLVEICPTPWTDTAVVERTMALMTEIGQTPIRVEREIPGFILNRLQWALLGEALHLVAIGACTAEDIDKVMTRGLALRWALAGPFEIIHLNAAAGVRGYFETLGSSFERVWKDLHVKHPVTEDVIARVHAAMSERIPEARIPERQRWRDNEIRALIRHLDARGSPDNE